MPEEIEVAEPVVEPEPFTLPEDFATQVQQWDIPVEHLGDAAAQYKALQTEEGVIDAFIATGQSLGFGLKDLNRLFEDEVPLPAAPTPSAPAVEPPDPDGIMTRAQVDEMIAGLRSESQAAEQARQQQAEEARQAQVFGAINQWYETNKVTDPAARRAIAGFGEAHIAPNQDSYDPRVALAALEAGKAEYEAWRQADAQAYLAVKQQQANAQPTPPGGGTGGAAGGGGDNAAPNYAELAKKGEALNTARERVRARLRESGDLG
jgi:hypothetical protein